MIVFNLLQTTVLRIPTVQQTHSKVLRVPAALTRVASTPWGHSTRTFGRSPSLLPCPPPPGWPRTSAQNRHSVRTVKCVARIKVTRINAKVWIDILCRMVHTQMDYHIREFIMDRFLSHQGAALEVCVITGLNTFTVYCHWLKEFDNCWC
jgi:hypothetical protein